MVQEIVQNETYTKEEIEEFFGMTNEEKIKKEYGLEDGEEIEITFDDGIIGTDASSFYNVKSIFINLEDRTIDIRDEFNHMVGLIHYKNTDEVTASDYDTDGNIKPKTVIIAKNGDIVIKLKN